MPCKVRHSCVRLICAAAFSCLCDYVEVKIAAVFYDHAEVKIARIVYDRTESKNERAFTENGHGKLWIEKGMEVFR